MFKNPFSFNGRIRRLEFGISYIIFMIAYVAIILLLEEFNDNQLILIFFFLAFIPLIWFLYAQGAKRCHDLNKSGWYQIIPFYVFLLLFSESEFGENDYGDNPKGEGNKSEIDEIGNNEEFNKTSIE